MYLGFRRKRWIYILLGIGLLLLIPLIAMQCSDEVDWTILDFVIAGFLLLTVAIAFEWILQQSNNWTYRIAASLGLIGSFLLFWVNGAVGIIGNEGEVPNLFFIAVFVVGILGTFLGRLRARGMAYTLFLMALTQMLIPTITLLIWPPSLISWAPGVPNVFGICAVFATIFVISGLLFWKIKPE